MIRKIRTPITRGNALMYLKEYQKAIADYTKAIELHPKMAGVYQSRAIAYEAIGEMAKAAADRKKYAELSSNPQ